MIALVYVTIAVALIYVLLLFMKSDSKESKNSDANLEKTPEEMTIPIYRPFKDGSFQMTMALEALDSHRWIQIDPNYRQEIRLKHQLLNSSRREDLLLYKNEAYDAAMETLKTLMDYLPNQYPNMFEKNHTNTIITNLITHEKFHLTESDHLHPLEIAALLVQEDLIIMQRDPNTDTYHANALAVCFPSGWLPKSKFGLPLALVHIPHVPCFEEKSRSSMDRSFLELKEENPMQRLNWTLQVGNTLCRTGHESSEEKMITKDNVGQSMYLRVERQTLRHLPRSNTILFTIKTYTTTIEDVCRGDPTMAQRLASAVRNWPSEMIEYKDVDRYKEGLLTYLDMMSSSEKVLFE